MPAPDGDPENPGDEANAPDATPAISDDGRESGDSDPSDDALDNSGEPPDATPTDDSETEGGTEEEKDKDESTSPDNGDTQSEPPPEEQPVEQPQEGNDRTYICEDCERTFLGKNAKERYASHFRTDSHKAAVSDTESDPMSESDTRDATSEDGQIGGTEILHDDPWAVRGLIGFWGLAVLGTIYFNYFIHGGHPDQTLSWIIAAVIILPLLFFFEMQTAVIKNVLGKFK